MQVGRARTFDGGSSTRRRPALWYGYFAALWLVVAGAVALGLRGGDDGGSAVERQPLVVNGTIDPAVLPSLPTPPAVGAPARLGTGDSVPAPGVSSPSAAAEATVPVTSVVPATGPAASDAPAAAPSPVAVPTDAAGQAPTPEELAAINAALPTVVTTQVPAPAPPTAEEIRKALDALAAQADAGAAAAGSPAQPPVPTGPPVPPSGG